MANGHTKQLQQLARGITALDKALQKRDRAALLALLKVIKRPGWTTPAELIMALGMVESLVTQVAAFNQLSAALIKGSRAVKPSR
jgi:hypothetical protein